MAARRRTLASSTMLMNARRASRACGLLLLLIVAGGYASGCGDDPAERPVRLEITAPTDASVINHDSVEVRGLVQPRGARVLVLGRRARVIRGEFRAVVPLREGSNLIDVGAGTRGAAPAWDALRVTREVLVILPDLTGATRDDAIDRLDAVGVRAEVQEEGDLLDELLGGDWIVCETQPPAGSDVRRGARIQLVVARGC
jgi:glucodextranase-like protein/PASTA domain-containing protein